MLSNSDTSINRSRALLTETDRERIASGADDPAVYQCVSRVRNRIADELGTDLRLLQQYHPELYAEVLEVVDDV
jgi:hypothetical protein